MRAIFGAAAGVCLLSCLVLPLLYFLGRMDMDSFRNLLAAASVGWFVFATAWQSRREQ
jgi:hypothetical protein